MLRFVFVKQSDAMFHNNVPQQRKTTSHNAQSLVHLLRLLQSSLQAGRRFEQGCEWISKKPKFGLQQMGNAPKITRPALFLGKCHRVAMVACLNNVKLSVVLPQQEP
jgi:hypothetical protein